jgi:hypothetical protein
MTDLEEEILQFMKKYYTEHNEPPSIKTIEKSVNGATRRQFYNIFPGKIKEACKKAGIPISNENIRSTEKAIEAKQKRNIQKSIPVESPTSYAYTLNNKQMQRVYAISHLEGGKNISTVIDELLDYDAELRLKYNITLDQVKQINDYLTAAQPRRWSINMLLNIQTTLWNAGFNDTKSANNLYILASKYDTLLNQNKSINSFNQLMEDLLDINFANLTPEEKLVFINISKDIKANGWTGNDFINIEKKYLDFMFMVRKYLRNESSLQELERWLI